MQLSSNFAKAEKRVFYAYWQDGLLDIFAGASVAVIGVCWLLGGIVATLGLPIVAICLWTAVRRRVTEPRLGRVTFTAKRSHDLKHGLIAIVSLGIVLFGFIGSKLWRHGATSAFEQWLAPAIPALLLALMCLSCAEALRLGRFVIHALAFAAGGLIAAAARFEPVWALIIGGSFVTCWGAAMLRTFLRDFPPLPSEPIDELS